MLITTILFGGRKIMSEVASRLIEKFSNSVFNPIKHKLNIHKTTKEKKRITNKYMRRRKVTL